MRMTALFLSLLLIATAAVAQKAVPPPPKPADKGPSLAVTMKFIEDKLNDQGRVGYVMTRSDMSAITVREFYQISNVVAGAATCTLRTMETTDTSIEAAPGYNYTEGGQQVTGDDLNRHKVATTTIFLRKIESIQVEAWQNLVNRQWAEAAHPEISSTYTPAVVGLTLIASKPVFSFHNSFTVGKRQAVVSDDPSKEDFLTFRDEETANRVAKALTHAVELCGGGNKEPF